MNNNENDGDTIRAGKKKKNVWKTIGNVVLIAISVIGILKTNKK